MKTWWIIDIKQSLVQTHPILAKNPHCCWITVSVGQRFEKMVQRSLKNRCSSWHLLLFAVWQYPRKTPRKTDKLSSNTLQTRSSVYSFGGAIPWLSVLIPHRCWPPKSHHSYVPHCACSMTICKWAWQHWQRTWLLWQTVGMLQK